MAEVEQPVTSTDLMLACCLCTGILRDAVQLACLHNCCRQCFSTAASQSSSQGVECVLCGTVTQVGSQQQNGFIDGQVQCYTLNAESGMCGVCTEKGEHDKPAVVWCLTCRHSLCEDCVKEHEVNNRQHTMQCLEELKSLDELCAQATGTSCAIHKKPLDFACLNCEQAKCSTCVEKCMERKHETHVVSEQSFESFVGDLVTRISTIESELLRKSEVLEKPKSILREAKEARDRYLNDLRQRKRRIVDAVERVFETMELSVTSVYDDLQGAGEDAAAAADSMASHLSDARNYICRLLESNSKCEIFKQHKIIRERLNVLSDMLDSLSERLATSIGEVKIEDSLPDNVEEVVGAWIGKLHVYSASSLLLRQQQQQQQQQYLYFSTTYASVQLPVLFCRDVALTMFGRLLLAAYDHGLVEVSSSSGRELSRWLPPKHDNSRCETVDAVAALSDGRAAVSLFYAQCVVVLRRSKERRREDGGDRAAGSSRWQRLVVAADDSWTEDLRVQLPWSPRWLSALGDVLAASAYLDLRLQLLSLSTGQLLSTERQRKYGIGSLAVTTRAVVTGSNDKVKLGFGRRAAYVIDAHSLADDGRDERLWRRALSSRNVEERVQAICTDSRCLYAAIWSGTQFNDSIVYDGGRLSVLSMVDGSELRRVALSFDPATALQVWHPTDLPNRLSLSNNATLSSSSSNSSSGCELLLAMLYYETDNWGRAVTVHRCTTDALH